MIEFAAFLDDRGRFDDARPVVSQGGEIVNGTGAALLERQVADLDARLA